MVWSKCEESNWMNQLSMFVEQNNNNKNTEQANNCSAGVWWIEQNSATTITNVYLYYHPINYDYYVNIDTECPETWFSSLITILFHCFFFFNVVVVVVSCFLSPCFQHFFFRVALFLSAAHTHFKVENFHATLRMEFFLWWFGVLSAQSIWHKKNNSKKQEFYCVNSGTSLIVLPKMWQFGKKKHSYATSCVWGLNSRHTRRFFAHDKKRRLNDLPNFECEWMEWWEITWNLWHMERGPNEKRSHRIITVEKAEWNIPFNPGRDCRRTKSPLDTR